MFEQVEQGRLYTPEELLAEHGYDPDKWRAKSSTSNNRGKVDEQGKMQYQHKISVVPKELAPTPEELTEKLNAIQPQTVDLLTSTSTVFMHHGDKRNNKPLLEVMVSKYAKEWGESQSRYLIT